MYRPATVQLLQRLISRHEGERGQTTTEYVAVLVVAVGLALGVGWFALSPILENVLNHMKSFTLDAL